MNLQYWKNWFSAAGVRAIKTMAQVALGMMPAAVSIMEVDWKWVLGTSALSGVISLLTSLVGLPEVSKEGTE